MRMIPLMQMVRSAEVKGKTVEWCNFVGPFVGQNEVWTFKSETDAKKFAAYASDTGAPPLNDPALKAAKIPRPIKKKNLK